jgi:hypothetical protein
LPHLLRDLEYIIETPGTAIRLLLPGQYPVHPALSTNSRDAELLTFGTGKSIKVVCLLLSF